ncbi:Conidiation-specific protein 13 [Hypsizygus marmoreus]|uniref:Conidiation-specific protein 13 n=1 Tax=Hypsizygus marmoreus TaxID=39966 RepID=A0A369JKH8_HYPMA|nr:Conidiation-specific protein 13 [Hypsizygus marmoreus]
MPSILTTLAFVATFVAAPALADLGKPPLRPDLSYLDGPFWQYLAPTQATWDQWGYGWIPQSCADEVNRNHKCAVTDVQVFNVHYNDCPTAWVMCRCNNAEMSIVNMVDAFGRLPVRYRQWIRHPIAFSDSSTWAYAVNGEIVFHKNAYVPTVWIHESSHILDAFAISVNGGRYSQTQAWLDTINQDPKVPDNYANTNSIEDFAQVANVALFDKLVPNGFGSVEPNWDQIFHQYATVEWVMGDNLFQGGTCTRRWADSTIIPMTGVAKVAAGKVGPKPAYMPKSNNTNAPPPLITKETPSMEIIRDTHFPQAD